MTRTVGVVRLLSAHVLLLLILLSGSSHASDSINPIVLTDEIFEHDTQASTGQTTGMWAIRFCSGEQAQKSVPSPCSQTDAVWRRLASDLLESENILVADVHVEKEKGLLKRFEKQLVVPSNGDEMKRHPVVIMFRQHRNMYVKDWILPKGLESYDDEGVFEEMREWITSGWETASSPVDVPSQPSLYGDILARLSSIQMPALYYIPIPFIVLWIARGLKNQPTKRD